MSTWEEQAIASMRARRPAPGSRNVTDEQLGAKISRWVSRRLIARMADENAPLAPPEG